MDAQLELLEKLPENENDSVNFKMPTKKMFKIVFIKSLFLAFFLLVFVGSFFTRQFLNSHEAYPSSTNSTANSSTSLELDTPPSPFLSSNLTHLIPL
jgi:hypothetical protein